jgi:alkylation response protein AidB-like acyl-CoA dehydrogenase
LRYGTNLYREAFGGMDSPLDSRYGSDGLLAVLMKERPIIRQTGRYPDAKDRFPIEIIDLLRQAGALRAPLPRAEGGLGWGTEDDGLSALCEALQILGSACLSVGRIYEAHVNAIALIFRYGDADVRSSASDAVRSGHLFGLWVAPAAEPVRLIRSGSRLQIAGRKAFCTAAGFATRAVITARNHHDREQMVMLDATHAETGPDLSPTLHGMRGTATKAVAFDCDVPMEHRIGGPDDYLREPDFSAGAWRTSAVTAGGLQALVDETIRQLRARDRHTDPHQAARIGQMLIKSHSATAWVRSAAERLASGRYEDAHLTAYVNLARVAVEHACLEIIPLVQRSLGLGSLIVSNPVEGMMNDLATYLRQPAGDEALTEAATIFAETPNPSALGDAL